MILIVHLSDIHIKGCTDSIFEKKSKIFDTFKNKLHNVDKVFFVITGDVAYSGQESEYLNALELIAYLKGEVDKLQNETSSVICVPGNHDCNINDKDEAVREVLIDSVNADNAGKIEYGIIETCTNCQKNYREFAECIVDNENTVYSDLILSIYKYEVDGEIVQFNCFNTALLSKKHEHQGRLGFPVDNYSDDIFSNTANLSVSLLHHPSVWHNAMNARQVQDLLRKHSGIIFTGHEHIKGKSAVSDLKGKYTEYIEGMILQDGGDPKNSGFNLVFIDIQNCGEEIINYKFKNSRYETEETVNISLADMNGIIVESLTLHDEIYDFINDPGITIQSRFADNIRLADIFVYPDIVSLKLNKFNYKSEKIISSEKLLGIDETPCKTLLQGGEKYGKTTFCKIAFTFFLKNKKIPIYVNGSTITTSSEDEFVKIILKHYLQQYRDKKEDDFNQLDRKNIYLIIDDFDRCRLNTKYKGKLLSIITSIFINVIITVGDLFKIEEIIYDENKKLIALDQYKQYKMLSFGNVLRAELINKWNVLGREAELEEEELVKANDVAIRLINSVIGKNLVPSYPIFIITLLQSIEAGTPHDLKTSSQGHYYNFLITLALGQLKLKAEQVNFYYNFLTVLSYEMFDNNIKQLSDFEFKEFYEKLKHLYIVTEEYSTVVTNLIKIRLLDIRGGNYCFRYKYVYYYFTAKYLSDHINETKIKTCIGKMTQRAYNEEFANILMYLTHHSKDPFVLENILASARHIFENFEPIKLESDVNILNKLVDYIPKLVLSDTPVNEARRKKLKQNDEIDNIPEIDEKQFVFGPSDLDEDVENLDLLKTLNLAFKTIEILGQLVKNYHGAVLKDSTIDLATETYLISLRALKSFFVFIENHLDAIVNEIKTEIVSKHLTEKDEKEKFSREMLFFICTLVSFGFIKKVSNSIGAENLGEVYQKVYERYSINSVNLINASITMDFSFSFPFAQISKIKNIFGHHHLVLNLLRQMATEYLYMFPTEYNEKQKICKALDISMDTQRLIDATSTQKKLIHTTD